MLRLEKLEMIGFKSFLSRTEFRFDQGITAVVGPNGCGKSNIADALHWVIGEQSVKSLRGDRMEDVIFNGSEGRKPTGMAEVSLHLKNGLQSEEEESLVVTRRLFRSGESEYLINGEKARLKDLQEALARMNVGSGLYSIIEQGKVDFALSSRPRERRVLIEEAAGISLYKTKRRQAEVKLEATQANLLRVNDIVSELERQFRSLRRQAARARRFGRTVEQIRRLEGILLYHEHERLRGELEEVELRESSARARESEAMVRLARIEAEHQEAGRLLEEKDHGWRLRREELHALERSMDHHEREIALARDQAAEARRAGTNARQQVVELAGRLEDIRRQAEARRADREKTRSRLAREEAEQERLDRERQSTHGAILALERELEGTRSDLIRLVDELSEARNNRRQAEAARERLERQSRTLSEEGTAAREELEEATSARATVEKQLHAVLERISEIQADLGGRREELSRLEKDLNEMTGRREEVQRQLQGGEERLKALQEIETTRMSTRQLLAAVEALESGAFKDWLATGDEGILSSGLRVPKRLEAAVEAYLKDFLDAALVADAGSALKGISSLKRTGAGRAAFLPVEAGSGESPVIGLPEEVRSDDGFVGRLGDLMEGDASRLRALSASLARAVVVTDLTASLRLRRRAPFFDYVTLDGDVLHINGLVEGGATRPEGAGLLSRRRLLGELRSRIRSCRDGLSEIEARISGLEANRAAGLDASRGLVEELAEREKESVALRLHVEAAGEKEDRARSRLETLSRERSLAAEEARSLESELERLNAGVQGLEAERGRSESTASGSQQRLAELRAREAAMAEALSGVRSSLSACGQRLEAQEADLARLEESEKDLRSRNLREKALGDDYDRRHESALQREVEASKALQELGSRRDELEARVREGEVELAQDRIESEQRHAEAKASREALEEIRGQREQITLEKERVIADLRHLASGTPGGEGGSECFQSMPDEEKALDLESLRADLAGLREKRDRMGPVNMMALQQFKELEERHGFLAAQRQDLNEAIASLKETIARINQTSRQRFLEAFEKVRVGFNEVFRSLFGGGRADLRLSTSDGEEDVLDCGLDIIAQPPGKRLQSISLLSGGEKALTALALLFAIFKFRPSPFCLLDEVDAPLDEANVLRFTGLVKAMTENTQFVLITHNQCSMESADVLYGITMEEPGVSRTISVVVDGETDRAAAIHNLPAQLAARHKGNGRRAALFSKPSSRDIGSESLQGGGTEV